MNAQNIRWVGGVTAVIVLVAYIAQGAVRLSAIEDKAGKVPAVEEAVKIITLYIKLVDPVNFERAKELARDK